MSPTSIISPALLDTILGPLAQLFLIGAAGDLTVARHAASQMLAAYNAETPEELRLASEVITFSLHSLDALSKAAEPGLPLNKILRHRGSAVSLSRESHKAQRKLDQLQRARRTGTHPQPAEAELPAPNPPVIETTKNTPKTETWSQSLQKRMTANRRAKKAQKNQARLAAEWARQQAKTAA